MNSKLIATLSGLALCTSLSAQQWLTTGNALSGGEWLGSSTAFDLLFKTSNLERMRISSGGNVMIGGTTAATEKLQIKNGNILMEYATSGSTGNFYLGGKTDASPPNGGMRLSSVSNSNSFIDVKTQNVTTGLVFRLDNTNGGTERMRINADGKIGINCATPSEKLQINNGIFKLAGPTSAGGPMIFFNASTSSAYAADWSIECRSVSTGGNPGLNFWKPFGSTNPGNDYLFLSDNTHVGINTNNPTAQLTVNGNVLIGDPATVTLPAGYKLYVETGILTEKVKVAVKNTVNWSDYVFAKDYALKPLAEVEAYISKNHHLPNVPSAQKVVEEGIDLGKMDATLLEKIEELTLYLIQQNKKIGQLESELLELKKSK